MGKLSDTWNYSDKSFPITYQQLTRDERYMIVQLRRQRCGLSEIARLMGRSRSTIWRELKRSMIQTRHGLGYCVSKAQEQRNGRLRRSRRGPQHSPEDYALVRRLLLQQWSPEQISGTLGRLNELQISHQTIYRYIRRDWRSGGDLWQELRRRYKRRKRHYGLEKRGRLQGKPTIEARPSSVEARQELGHYEGDTVHGANWEKTCVVTLVERATGLVLVGKSRDKTVRSVNKVLIRLLDESPLPVRTLTLDNGTEFHGYRAVEEATGVQIYFARPHHPWQRGSNENANGLLRQYWPKRTSMQKLSQRQCDQVAHKLNSRPRKRYGYLSPLQLIT